MTRSFSGSDQQRGDLLVLVDVLTELLYYGLTLERRAQWVAVSNVYLPELEPYQQEKTNFQPSFESARRRCRSANAGRHAHLG